MTQGRTIREKMSDARGGGKDSLGLAQDSTLQMAGVAAAREAFAVDDTRETLVRWLRATEAAGNLGARTASAERWNENLHALEQACASQSPAAFADRVHRLCHTMLRLRLTELPRDLIAMFEKTRQTVETTPHDGYAQAIRELTYRRNKSAPVFLRTSKRVVHTYSQFVATVHIGE